MENRQLFLRANEISAIFSLMTAQPLIDFRLSLAEDLKSDWDTANSFSPFYKMLDKHPLVKRVKERIPPFKMWMEGLDLKERVMILTLVSLDQADSLFTGWEKREDPAKDLRELAQKLFKIELFYEPIGGIIGYTFLVLKLLQKKGGAYPHTLIETPPKIDMKEPIVRRYVREGLKKMPLIGEVYPVGGAGDRLNLRDPKTGEALPQAKLQFEGRTLLEGLIRDLKAREVLYERVYGKSTLTPIALMTSSEKMNTRHMIEILEENNWFERPRESYFLFEQPLVPVISVDGTWAANAPFEPLLKPGGHGVLWLLMDEYRVFDWFKKFKRDYLIVRQINNPIAGLDDNLLALAGMGIKEKKAFGFLSCPRLCGSSEGMNVLLQSKNEDGYHSTITNIEYTDFALRGIEDKPMPSEPYSKYPSNTNILFASIKDVKKALEKSPLPGIVFNAKTKVPYLTEHGLKETLGGRLESTMQNIADHMTSQTQDAKVSLKDLKTFLLYNDRGKTISVTKKEMKKGESLAETPMQAWLDKQKAAYALFEECGFKLPPFPDAVIEYSPSLGPLYSIIKQKVKKGALKKGSELLIEGEMIAIEGLDLDGSLKILAPEGRVFLKNILVTNKGLNLRKKHKFWQGTENLESLVIECEEHAEFWAENAAFEKPLHLIVPRGHKTVAKMVKGKLEFITKKISKPSWKWEIGFNSRAIPALTFKLE